MIFGGRPIPKQFKIALYASMFNLIMCYINAYTYWGNATTYNLGSAVVSLIVATGIYYWTRKQIQDMFWNTLKRE